MLGDTSTGKTSLLLRFTEGHYRDGATNPTVGAFFIAKRMTVQGVTCKIQIWDTAGQDQFKNLAPMYYKNAHCAVICYDMSSPKTFDTLQYWLDELQSHASPGLVVVLCATKSDLQPNADTSEVERLAESTGALFFSTSAKKGTNVNEVFEKLSDIILEKKKENPESFQVSSPSSISAKGGVFQTNSNLSSPQKSIGKSDEKKDEIIDGMSTQTSESTADPKAGCYGFLCGDMM